MGKSHRSTGFDDPDIPDGLQTQPQHWGTCYIGKRADILAAGILPAELLPLKFQDFDVIHNGQRIKGSKWGWGKWTRWELHVHHERQAPTLTLVLGDCIMATRKTPQELSPQLPDDFEGIDMAAFTIRLHALANLPYDLHALANLPDETIEELANEFSNATHSSRASAENRPTLTLIQGGRASEPATQD